MKKALSLLLLCGVLLTACASRATYHEDIPPAPTTESAEPTAEAPAQTSENADSSAEAVRETVETAETAEAPNSTEEAIAAADDHGAPGLEAGAAFRFNGAEYVFELPADLAVISEVGGLMEWRSDVHNKYFANFGELEDVSGNAVLNEFDSGKWYLASDGKLLHLRQVTQEEYDSMTGFGVDCPPDNEYMLTYEVENIYNVLFYAPAN